MQIKVNHRTSEKAGLDDIRVLSGIIKSSDKRERDCRMMNRTSEAFIIKSVLTKKEKLEAKYNEDYL